jgi:hypothetical protein
MIFYEVNELNSLQSMMAKAPVVGNIIEEATGFFSVNGDFGCVFMGRYTEVFNFLQSL